MTPEKLAELREVLPTWEERLPRIPWWCSKDAEALAQLRGMLVPSSIYFRRDIGSDSSSPIGLGHNEQVDLDGNVWRLGISGGTASATQPEIRFCPSCGTPLGVDGDGAKEPADAEREKWARWLEVIYPQGPRNQEDFEIFQDIRSLILSPLTPLAPRPEAGKPEVTMGEIGELCYGKNGNAAYALTGETTPGMERIATFLRSKGVPVIEEAPRAEPEGERK